RLRSGVLIDRLVGALREGRRVVHRVDGDGESLSGGGVLAAAVGAAVVPQPDGYHCRAVGVGGRRVGERAGRRVDGRGGRERAGVVGADQDRQGLARLVGGAGADVGGPTGHGLWAGVLVNDLGRAGRKRRGVVDGVDGDREGLRRAGVLAAVGGA